MKTNPKSLTIDELIEINVDALKRVKSDELLMAHRWSEDESGVIQNYTAKEIAEEVITAIVDEVAGSINEGKRILQASFEWFDGLHSEY